MAFLGRVTYNLDDKNRLVIPAHFCEQLDENAIVSIGFENTIVVYPGDEWKKFCDELQSHPTSNENVRMVIRYFVSSGVKAQIDKQNRLKIPAEFIDEQEITKECVVMGVNNHIEIWSKEKWVAYHKLAKQNLSALAEKFDIGGF